MRSGAISGGRIGSNSADRRGAGPFDDQRTENERYWQPNESIVVATGDALRHAPAQWHR